MTLSALVGDGRPVRLPGGRPTRLGSAVRGITVLIAAGDLAVLLAAVALAWTLRQLVPLARPADPELSLATSAGPEIVLGWLVVLAVLGGYSRRFFGAGVDEYRVVLTSSFASAGLIGFVCYLSSVELSRGFVLLTFAIGTPALLVHRYAARLVVHRARRRGRLQHRVIAVGGARDLAEVCAILGRESHLGYEVVGACTPPAAEPEQLPVPLVGEVAHIRAACERVGADTVLVTGGGDRSSADLRHIAWDLEGIDVDLIVVPGLTEVAGPRIHVRPVAGLPLIHLQRPQVDQAGGLTKRAFDVAGALVALVLLAPLMLAVALAIRLEDGGSVLFRQERVGRRATAFPCFKFRSMIEDAARLEPALREAEGHLGALWKSAADPRITRVGGWIRRYSLDELPQLFNVLLGDMSLVGPRPQQAWEVETYSDSAKRRLLVRPGMTGLWQVSGRSRLTFEEAVRLDLYYVDNWSMSADLVIMAKTAKAVLSSDGAR